MADYQGNHVAYGNGGIWHVVAVVNNAPVTTAATVSVEYAYDIVFTGSISDSTNTISWDDPWGHGERNNFTFNGAGRYRVGGVYTANPGVSYGAATPLNFAFYATGMAGGGTGPSEVRFTHWLPARVPSPPSPPIVGVNSVTATSAFIWTAAAGAENGATAQLVNYRIHRTSDGAHIGDYQTGYGGLTWHGLARGTGYTAYAQVRNAAGWGGWSSGVSFTTSATAPDQPLSPYAVNVQQTTIGLAWTPPNNGGSPLQGWDVELATDPGFGAKAFARSFAQNVNGWTIDGLQIATTYFARVRTWNYSSGGNTYSAWSPILAITTLGAPPWPPGAPVATGIVSTMARVKWEPAQTRGSAVTGYDLQVDDNADFSSPKLDLQNLPTSAAVDGVLATGLSANTQYYVRVRALSELGPSVWSLTSNFRTVAGFSVNVGGFPKVAEIWTRTPNYWHRGQLFVNVQGTWRQITFDSMLKVAVTPELYPPTYLPTY